MTAGHVTMAHEACLWVFCFSKSGGDVGSKIFGFSEFITALALLVVLYTITDIRFRFRISVASSKLYGVTYGLILLIGSGTLLTDVWVASGWWVPVTVGLDRPVWEATLAALFLGTFATWMYYAFIRPPIFSKRTASRYAYALFHIILKGDSAELAAIAIELRRSARSLIKLSSLARRRPAEDKGDSAAITIPGAPEYAHDVLMLIGNRKFCREIVRASPATAIEFFDAMDEEKLYDVPIGQFAQGISAAAIENKESILYQEGDRFSSDLIGSLKPWSQAIYGRYEIIRALGDKWTSPLDLDYDERTSWDPEQWGAYSRIVLASLEGYLRGEKYDRDPRVIYLAFSKMEAAVRELYKLNDSDGDATESAIYRKLPAVVNFIKEVVELLDKYKFTSDFPRKPVEKGRKYDLYDYLADLMFEVIFSSSAIKGPPSLTWWVYYNGVWDEFFGLETSDSWGIVRYKLRRLLYDEVKDMEKMPNYKGARILGYLLNVLGVKTWRLGHTFREARPLNVVIVRWTRAHYMKIHSDLPEVAKAVLIGSIAFDEKNRRLVKTYAQGLNKKAPEDHLDLT